MSLKKCYRNYRKVRKLLQIENFLCCFEIESSLPVAGLFIAVPCCILTYHDAVFLWEYMKERNEEEVRSGTRSPEVFEFIKCCEIFVFIFSSLFSFLMQYMMANRATKILRLCIVCSMTLTLSVFIEGVSRKSLNLIAFFAFNFYYTLCIYSTFKRFCREIYEEKVKMLQIELY
ncbi:unnamed protein product [Chironomus riparius]|uniref:Uncharacterized protein n=1 Tax=Chironomus riparius TaxID=315576 RepID=A0A9N9S958_9DIPT|nr:unnamed protein product [Chironomus riparius]